MLQKKQQTLTVNLVLQIRPVFGVTSLPDLADVVPTGEVNDIEAQYNTAIYVLLIHIVSAYLCYIFGERLIF